MGCGAALLHDSREHGFTELFVECVNVLPPYLRLRAETAAASAREALARPYELAELALAGRELAAARHTDEARARELCTLAGPLLGSRAHEARLATLPSTSSGIQRLRNPGRRIAGFPCSSAGFLS